MTTESLTELEAFREFLDEQIKNGQSAQSPEMVLKLWQTQQQPLKESIAAVKEALKDMDAGDTGKPLCEFSDEFRKKNNLRQDA